MQILGLNISRTVNAFMEPSLKDVTPIKTKPFGRLLGMAHETILASGLDRHDVHIRRNGGYNPVTDKFDHGKPEAKNASVPLLLTQPTSPEEKLSDELATALASGNPVEWFSNHYGANAPSEKREEFLALLKSVSENKAENVPTQVKATDEVVVAGTQPVAGMPEGAEQLLAQAKKTILQEAVPEVGTPEYFMQLMVTFEEALGLIDDQLRLNVLAAVKQQYEELSAENRGSFHVMDSKALSAHVNAMVQWRQSVVQTTYQLIAAEGAAPEVMNHLNMEAGNAMFEMNPEKYLRDQAAAKAIELAAATAQPEVVNPAMQEAMQAAAGQKTSGINRRNRRTAGDGQGA